MIEPKKVDVLKTETVAQAYFRLDAWEVRHEMYAGGMSGTVRRECLERGHAVAVLLYDPVADAVVLVEQFRIGALAAGLHPWLVEVVAGIIEDGESPADVALREITEESGLVAQDLIEVGLYAASPGCTSETIRLFAAKVDSSGAGGIHGLDAEHEDIRVMTMPAAQFIADTKAFKAVNATTLLAGFWFALNHEDLKAKWSG